MHTRRATILGYRIALALLGASAAVLKVTTGTQSQVPVDWRVLAIAVGAAAMLFLDNLRQAWRKFREPRRDAVHEQLRIILYTALQTISTVAPGVPITKLGINLWIRDGLCLRHGRPKLQRIQRWRLSTTPQNSRVAWCSRKGTTGRCCANEKKEFDDLRDINATYAKHIPNKEAYSKLDQSVTHGLRLREFRAILGKYDEVVAVPLKADDGKLFGVVSVDIASDANAPKGFLNSAAVEEALNHVAFLVRREDLRLLR